MTIRQIMRATCDVCGCVAETTETEPTRLAPTAIHHRAITFAEVSLRAAVPLWAGDCCDRCLKVIEGRLRMSVETIMVGIKDEREEACADFGPVVVAPPPPQDDEIPF